MRTLLHGGSAFEAKSAAVGVADVVIEAGYVVDVGPGLDGDEAVDCSGLTLLPGLIDCHAHMAFAGMQDVSGGARPPSYRLLRALPTLRRTLELGVTTVRDAWGADAGLRDAIDHGLVQAHGCW